MAIGTKESSQDKASNRVDRNLHKKKKFVPLMERNFNDLVTLAEQLEWVKRKQKLKDKNQTF